MVKIGKRAGLGLLLAGIALQGCATTGGGGDPDPAAALKQAQSACKALIETKLKAPVSTEIGPRMKEIKAATAKEENEKEAAKLASDLAASCQQETRLREELGDVAYEVHLQRTQIPRHLYNRFMKLTLSGKYTLAIYCGDGLLNRQLDRCDPPGTRRPSNMSNTVTILDTAPDGSASESVLAYKEKVAREKAARRKAQPSREVKEAMARAHRDALAQEDAMAQAELPPDLDKGEQKKKKPEKPRLWTWIALGGAGAFFIAGGILGGLSYGQYEELEKSCPNCTQEEIDSGHDMAVGADVMFALGAVAAAGGAVLFFMERKWFGDDEKKEEAGEVTVGLTPGGLNLTGRF